MRNDMGMRQFIDALSRESRLQRISQPVDWRYELGEMTRHRQLPLLFENIRDYPGYRLFTNGLSSVAFIGLALGLTSESTRKQIVAAIKERMRTPIPPSLTETGPVFENVVQADKINLSMFPVPHWNRQDAGRYLGTWHINVTKDPETGTRNVGIYRMQLMGPRQATVSTSPGSHLTLHFAKAEKQGRPLEMAVAIGVSEAVIMAAAAAYPCGLDEYDLAGSLQEESLQLVRCQTVNLEVPAETEILIEGHIKPGVRVQDGPYLDYAGKPNTNPHAFLFEADRLTFRNNPIFRGTAVGVPGAEDQQLFSVLAELNLVDFHGSRRRQQIQNQLLRRRLFRTFQWVGRVGPLLRRLI